MSSGPELQARRVPLRGAVGARLRGLLWAWRVELAIAGVPLVLWLVLRGWLSMAPSWLPMGIVVVILGVSLVVPGVRAWLRRLLVGARVRRVVEAAFQVCQLTTPDGRAPRVVGVCPVGVGERVMIRLPAGGPQIPRGGMWPSVQEAAERLAVALEVRDVRVSRDSGNAARGELLIVRADPLAAVVGSPDDPWPYLGVERVSLWQPVPVARDELGNVVSVRLAYRSEVAGGHPDAGKSSALAVQVAAAALDPSVPLLLFDGGRVDLAPWRDCAEVFVGNDADQAVEVLEGLRGELDRRLVVLERQGRRRVEPGMGGLPLVVVAIDELAWYLNTGNKQRDARIAEALWDLVARGRKTGLIVLAATTKPSAETVPSRIRDQMALRWAFRCTNSYASDTILGDGWAQQGVSAASIPLGRPGVGWLFAEGSVPRLVRGWWLRDEEIRRLASRAARLRAKQPPARVLELPGAMPGVSGGVA